MRPDVLVVGGGAAGIAAAVGAAAAGARTALVESAGMLGGNATASLLGTICGLYVTGGDGVPSFANGGFARRFAERLSALPGCAGPAKRGRVFVLPYAPFAFAWLADRVADEWPVDLRLHTHCVGVEARGRRLEAVRLAGPDGERTVPVGAVVDATGDGVVAAAAGAAVPAGTEAQPAGMVFVLQRVDTRALEGPRALGVLRGLAAAAERGRLPPDAARVVFGATAHPGELLLKLTLPAAAEGARDALTEAAVEGRRRVAETVRVLVEEEPAFREAFLSHVAPRVGVREKLRLVGRECLTKEDVVGAREREGAVARGAWPIELWAADRPGPTYEYVGGRGTYDIPEGCLIARDVDNLFAAGRCLSATHEALGSARVIGTALATGELAGRAAARSADTAGRVQRA